MQYSEKKAFFGYRRHVNAALTALLLCLAGPAAAVEKTRRPCSQHRRAMADNR
ncbi:hypothetical protein [Serratia marcescens]|uniref:hypothetical protein n=1 Tax=Serratia marcescens TaxID=615 RepID=UPI001FB61561|nr:hypothetical protein [Serratia marcescens]